MLRNTEIPIVSSKKVLGHLVEYKKNPLEFLLSKWEEKGDIFKFRVAHRSLIVISNPDCIKHILQDNHVNYRKNLAYRKLKLLLGNGLFTSEGDFWLKQRRLAQPAFHKERIENYFKVMVRYTEEVVAQWKAKVIEGSAIAINKEMTELTLKIICKTLLGIDSNYEGKVVEENLPFALKFMMERVTSAVNLPLAFPIKTHKKFKESVDRLYVLIDKIINEKRKRGVETDDLLSMLMEVQDEESGEKMSDQQLKDEVLTFFLAGHETSAIALTWALYLIQNDKEVYGKLKEEVDLAIGDNSLDLASLKKLTFTTQVIKETLRLIAPVWILGREALNDDQIGGYPIKKGDSIIFSPYIVHCHPKYWDSPEVFDPERFREGYQHTMQRYAYFPFGGGPRLCIGSNFALMEMLVILSLLVKSFNFPSEKIPHPGYNFSLTLRPGKEIYFKMK